MQSSGANGISGASPAANFSGISECMTAGVSISVEPSFCKASKKALYGWALTENVLCYAVFIVNEH